MDARRSAKGARRAPSCFPRLLLAALAFAVATVAGAADLLVATSGGRDLVLLDARGATRWRIALDAPLVALAAFDPADGVAYAGLRDGRVLAIAAASATVVAQAQVGETLEMMAASSDGRHLAVVTARPPAIVVLDPRLAHIRQLPARDAEGRRSALPTALVDVAARHAFVAALPGLNEVWELRYDDAAPPVYPGLVHDFRLGEGIARPGRLEPRRAPLDAPLASLLPADGAEVVASGGGDAQVLHLDVRRRIASLPVAGDVAAGARWPGTLALPAGRSLRLFDAATWRERAVIACAGEVRLVRSRVDAQHAFAVVRDDDGRDGLQRVDKRARSAGETWRLPAGAAVVAVSLPDARTLHVLASGAAAGVWTLDAATLATRGHVPLPDPVALLALR